MFIPHGHCYLWKTGLVWLHLVSDSLIAVAYYSIPITLFYFVQKRKDLPFNWIFILFGAFIVACGTTHLMEVWTFWHPTYWLSGAIKAVTAAVSLYTAGQLVPLVPQALALPSPRQLEVANRELQAQISERQRVDAALQQLNANLERQVQERTAQLQQALNFEAMLKRITDKVRDSLDESQILQIAIQELVLTLGVICCDTALYNLEQGSSTIRYEYTASSNDGFASSDFRTLSSIGRVVQMTEFPQGYHQLLQGQYFQFCELTLDAVQRQVAILACPIIDDQGVLGDLWLFKYKEDAFNELEIRLVQQVANQCAIAIRQARLYQAATAQVEELEKLNQFKDDFLRTVSHELRTPLFSITLATQMLEVILEQEGVLNGEHHKAARYLQILDDECQREIILINNLLDLSRLQAKAETLMLTTIDPRVWISHVVEPFVERAHRQQQHLQIDIPASLPLLTTDLSHFERILTELLNNACKYTPPAEKITITADATAESFQLSVSNSGVEIAKAELERIFDKFYRIPNNDPWKKGGTGLGLALVKKLVEHIGGTIAVESTTGQTTFTVQLPIGPK